MLFVNKTFNTELPPKGMTRYYELVSFFRDALFEFLALFMLLYVQLSSPIHDSPEYESMFFAITMGMVAIKVIAGFCWLFSSHLIEIGRFPHGRYRTFILIGLGIYSVAFTLLFYVAPFVQGWGYVALFLILYLIIEAAYSINDIGYWSYVTTLTSNEKRRSQIAAWMNVFLTVGDYLIAGLSPAITASRDPALGMRILATVLISTNFISQVILAIIMKEREEPEDDEETRLSAKKAGFFDAFKMAHKEPQLWVTTLVIFLIFLAQDCLIGNSATYFYYEYGYGTFGTAALNGSALSGGVVSFIFTVCYGAGFFLSQLVFPTLSAKLSKKTILILSGITLITAYLYLFFLGFSSGYEITLFITTVILAFAHGLTYTCYMMNCFDMVEMYDLKQGVRKDAPIQSLKAFGVLTANAVQTGIFYVFLAASGLIGINDEVAKANQAGTSAGEINAMIHAGDITWNLLTFKSGITLLPALLTLAAFLITIFFVKINDETYYEEILKKLKERRESQSPEA